MKILLLCIFLIGCGGGGGSEPKQPVELEPEDILYIGDSIEA